MRRYSVTLIKYETYYVNASDENEAVEVACNLCDDDTDAWMGPADDYEVSAIQTLVKRP